MGGFHLRVLSVEDDPDHAELLRLGLAAIPGIRLEFHHETDAPRGLLRASMDRFDAVFLDHALSAGTGEEVAQTLRARGYTGPIVLVTAHWRDHLPAAAARCGANAFLDKSRLTPERLATTLGLGDRLGSFSAALSSRRRG